MRSLGGRIGGRYVDSEQVDGVGMLGCWRSIDAVLTSMELSSGLVAVVAVVGGDVVAVGRGTRSLLVYCRMVVVPKVGLWCRCNLDFGRSMCYFLCLGSHSLGSCLSPH